MSTETYVLLGIIIIGFVLILIIIRKWMGDAAKNQNPSSEILEWLRSTNTRIDDQNRQIVSTLQNSTKAMNERLDNAARFIAAVQKNIGEMSEIGRGMKELQEFLQSPKLRGTIGEQILRELLSQMLPKQVYSLQYGYKSGVKVDALIKTANGSIPVDSKFPMENFRKIQKAVNESERKIHQKDFDADVKKHISDIAKKYIVTSEGTVDYALMYLPSESVYYEVVNNQSLYDFAIVNRIYPVSPMTFYAFLRAILMSFEGQRIESQAREILQTIRAVQKDYSKTEEAMGVLNRHLTNAYNQMGHVTGAFAGLGRKLSSTHLSGAQESSRTLSKEDKQLELED